MDQATEPPLTVRARVPCISHWSEFHCSATLEGTVIAGTGFGFGGGDALGDELDGGADEGEGEDEGEADALADGEGEGEADDGSAVAGAAFTVVTALAECPLSPASRWFPRPCSAVSATVAATATAATAATPTTI